MEHSEQEIKKHVRIYVGVFLTLAVMTDGYYGNDPTPDWVFVARKIASRYFGVRNCP